MELNYAPPTRSRQPNFIVLASGIASAVLTLVALHFVQQQVEADILTYTYAIIPVGATGVGLVAGSGYAVASRVSGMRVRGWLLLSVLALQLSLYGTGEYIEFVSHGPMIDPGTGGRLSFDRWVHLTTVNMRWLQSKEDEPPVLFQKNTPPPEDNRLGMEGYLYRGLGVLGFLFGGAVPLLIVGAIPYCNLCQRYMRRSVLLKMPASAPTGVIRLSKKIKLDTPEHHAALHQCTDLLEQARQLIQAGDIERFGDLMRTNHTSIASSVVLVGRLRINYCPQCRQGELIGELIAGPTKTNIPQRKLFHDALAPERVVALTA
jgi:hypothetical protein